MENKTCETCADNDDGLCDRLGILIEDDDTCEKHRSCDGCFGASFGDCQRCQESREKIKKEETTVGYKMEELAKALQEIYRCMPLISKEDIGLVRRNPSLSFLQKWRIIRQIRKSMKNVQRACETCSNVVYCGVGSYFCMESKEGTMRVIDDWEPTEDYLWCGGRKYEK